MWLQGFGCGREKYTRIISRPYDEYYFICRI